MPKVEVDLTRGLDDLPRHKRTLLLEIGSDVVEETLAGLAVKQLDSTGEHVNVLVGLRALRPPRSSTSRTNSDGCAWTRVPVRSTMRERPMLALTFRRSPLRPSSFSRISSTLLTEGTSFSMLRLSILTA